MKKLVPVFILFCLSLLFCGCAKHDTSIEIDKFSGKVKISDLELFELNSYELSDKGKEYLNKFVPIYINTVFSKQKVKEAIDNIVIQGHTDSQTFAGIYSADEQYVKNMELSLKRANAVASYIFRTDYDKSYNEILKKILVVEGKSSSEPILINGKEDYDKSRRVELRLNIKSNNIKDVLEIINK